MFNTEQEYYKSEINKTNKQMESLKTTKDNSYNDILLAAQEAYLEHCNWALTYFTDQTFNEIIPTRNKFTEEDFINFLSRNIYTKYNLTDEDKKLLAKYIK